MRALLRATDQLPVHGSSLVKTNKNLKWGQYLLETVGQTNYHSAPSEDQSRLEKKMSNPLQDAFVVPFDGAKA